VAILASEEASLADLLQMPVQAAAKNVFNYARTTRILETLVAEVAALGRKTRVGQRHRYIRERFVILANRLVLVANTWIKLDATPKPVLCVHQMEHAGSLPLNARFLKKTTQAVQELGVQMRPEVQRVTRALKRVALFVNVQWVHQIPVVGRRLPEKFVTSFPELSDVGTGNVQ
jgi:hypothetical protein